MKRRNTETITINNVKMGENHPVVIQSMTNTPTADTEATIKQIKELEDAGSELVRLTVNDYEAMEAIPKIAETLRRDGYTTPLIGDFHYNGHILLTKYPESARYLDKYRINPGNVGKKDKHDSNFSQMIEIALKNDKPVRIGVNGGSLDQELLTELMTQNSKLTHPATAQEVFAEAMIQSALRSADFAMKMGMPKNKLVLSVKMSDVQHMVDVYQKLASRCDYALHLGLTEAGSSMKGVAASSAALAILLQQGIGDTIRISLTPEPGKSRAEEVNACKLLLQSMGLRYFMPMVTSCPGCGRTNSDKFVYLAQDVTQYIEENMPIWKKQYPGVETLTIAVMGCVVNGPGESKQADIGISLPGSSEAPSIPVYQDGDLLTVLKGDQIKEQFIEILNTYIKKRFSIAQSHH
ncbi:4-hydroxy-3-methylbut-2-en-1-yl diphosphate synthase [bacterium]|nr:4-hydroxy-3-methylbut-2-en-1-yl diphosphate synthase [bacterium]